MECETKWIGVENSEPEITDAWRLLQDRLENPEKTPPFICALFSRLFFILFTFFASLLHSSIKHWISSEMRKKATRGPSHGGGLTSWGRKSTPFWKGPALTSRSPQVGTSQSHPEGALPDVSVLSCMPHLFSVPSVATQWRYRKRAYARGHSVSELRRLAECLWLTLPHEGRSVVGWGAEQCSSREGTGPLQCSFPLSPPPPPTPILRIKGCKRSTTVFGVQNSNAGNRLTANTTHFSVLTLKYQCYCSSKCTYFILKMIWSTALVIIDILLGYSSLFKL